MAQKFYSDDESLSLLTYGAGAVAHSQPTEDTTYLEQIHLNDKSIYFNRMQNLPANYYHWHQCAEILSVSRGVGIALMEHQQYTV